MDSPIIDIVPVTPTQQGLLYVERTNPESSLYHEQYIAELRGDLDLPKFIKAWQKTIDAHSILRTIFDWDGKNESIQIVLRQHSGNFVVHTDIASDIERTAIITSDAQAAFQLDTVPPHRVSLIKVDDNTHWFVFTYHHILLDGSSTAMLLDYLASQYNAPTDVTLLNDYGTYARWVEKSSESISEKNWNEYAANMTVPVVKNSEITNTKTNEYYYQLDSDVVSGLSTLSKTYHTTLNSIVQSAWALTMAKAKQQTTISVGSPVTVKPLDGRLDEVVGLCITTVPYILSFDGTTSLIDIALRHQQKWSGLIEHSHIGLSLIKKAINYHHYGDPFETILTYTDIRTRKAPSLTGIEWSVISHNEVTQYPLSIDVVVDNDSIELKATYRDQQYNTAATTSLVQSFANTLQQYVKYPTYVPSITIGVEKTQQEIATNRPTADAVTLQAIIDTWADVFETPVTNTSNFFELGGDSISSLRIVSKLLEKSISISMRDLFDSPTPDLIATISATKSTPKTVASTDVLVEVNEAARQLYGSNVLKTFQVSNVQQGILCQPQVKQNLYHDQSTFTYQGSMNPIFFERAWNLVIEHTDSLRLRYFKRDEIWYATLLKEKPISLDVIDLQNNSTWNDTIQTMIVKDRASSFNTQDEPLVRIKLFQTSADTFVLFLSFHVLVTDGWSFSFLLDDVFSAYEQLVNEREPVLARHEPSYSHYLNAIVPSDITAARQHWRQYLQATAHTTNQTITNFSHLETILTELSEQETTALQSVAKSRNLSVNSLVQAAWAITNAIDSTPFIFGATTSNRVYRDINYDNTIGLFFNDIPVVARVTTADITALAATIQGDFQTNLRYSYLSSYEIADLLGHTTHESPYDSLVVFENYPKVQEDRLKHTSRGGVTNTDYWRRDMADIPKTLYVEILDAVTTIKLSFNTDSLTAETAQNITDEFVRVLKTCIA
ncbi:MAG TPA: condensation domain-containing protein [Candidatus Microsaccharimonas sp.]